MGYNASVCVLLDRLDEIERDPAFGKKLAAAIRYRVMHAKPPRCDVSAPYVTGQTEVVAVAHADVMQIVAIGGNTGRLVGCGHYREDDDSLIRGLERDRRNKAKAAKSAA